MRLVLVPGLLNDGGLWRHQIADLGRDYDVVVADITQGEDLGALAEAVMLAGGVRFALAGFSLGGIVAQEVMRRAPERVSHLALLDTTMMPDNPERAAERAYLRGLAQNPGRFHGFGPKMMQSYVAPQNVDNIEIADALREMTQRLGAEVFIRQSLLSRPDGRADLGRITCPSLVLCGREDAITPLALSQEMAALIPDATLVVLDGAGHMTPLEAPIEVSQALRALLAR